MIFFYKAVSHMLKKCDFVVLALVVNVKLFKGHKITDESLLYKNFFWRQVCVCVCVYTPALAAGVCIII